MGMNVIYTDIIGENKNFPQYTFMSMEEVLKQADFVSLHIPAAKDGKPVVGKELLTLMKPTAYIINTARGGLICEQALCDALDGGKLAGAALDVFTEEPSKNERLLHNPKVSLTPHIGGSTKEAQMRIGQEIVDIITAFFA
ncbi:Glycerate dehydrogenase [bioreactor metagenome]|uniref:Glycerate dehydrogenase n=1 Tax=bioreactor metagenome TaxID=1076179 RepID=A0A645GDZ8_9ZZZZ